MENQSIPKSSHLWRVAFTFGAFVLGMVLYGLWRPEVKAGSVAQPDDDQEVTVQRTSTSTRPPETEPHQGAAGTGEAVAEEELPNPHYKPHPRDPYEWQGRIVNLAMMPACDGFCGLGMACVNGRCGPCSEDGQCRAGEACVLDHCLVSEKVECRRRSECEQGDEDGIDDYCVIAGVGTDFRGNDGLKAICRKSQGDNPDDSRQRAIDSHRENDVVVSHRAPSPMDPDQLLDRLVKGEVHTEHEEPRDP